MGRYGAASAAGARLRTGSARTTVADIRISQLVKRYDDGHLAVRGIDLHIRDQEFMVLVGPSGCGKTTTLRMIAGLEDISAGEIAIGGRRVNEVAPKDRDIAMVFQNYALYPHMTVHENMAYGLKLRKVARDEIERRVGAAAKMLGIEAQLPRLPKQLSGGQRQRVALGRAVVREPAAFLFDEPLSNLDAKLRGEMRIELKTLQRRLRTTMVYVTHDQTEAMTLGDRITVMSAGEIQQVDTPSTVYDQPRNRFVAGFIGTPVMNFLGGELARAGDGFRFTLLGGGGAGGAAVALRMPHRHALAGALGGGRVLGVRPEHISPANPASDGASRIAAEVDVVENMGDHQYVHLRLAGDQRAIMKTGGQYRCRVGERIEVDLDTAFAHVFADAGEYAATLTLPPG